MKMPPVGDPSVGSSPSKPLPANLARQRLRRLTHAPPTLRPRCVFYSAFEHALALCVATHRHTPRFALLQRRAGKLSVGPILLGFFFIVIVGSCECCRELNALATRVADMPSLAVSRSTALLQIIRQAGG